MVRFDDLFQYVLDYPPSSAQVEKAAQTPSVARLFPRGGGVYLLTDAEDRMIQLASAGNLRRALQNRLLESEPKDADKASGVARRKPKLGEITRKIRWQPAYSMFEINYVYYRIARVLMPDSYLENLAFGPSWFVHVDPSAPIPRFAAVKVLSCPLGVALGPFATSSDATSFIQILEDAFNLCRYHHILERVPNGQPCAYFEMGKCPAPCNGSIPMSDYRQMIASALSFARGQRAVFFQDLEDRMRELSVQRAFEQAQTVKRQLERARGVEHKSYRFVRPVTAFDYLVVQRGGGRTKLKPFFVRRGWITPGPVVKIKDLDKVVDQWVAALSPRADKPGNFELAGPDLLSEENRRQLSEQIWLVSHYLFKKDAPGLFLHSSELPAPPELLQKIRARFLPPQDKLTQSAGPASQPD